MPDICNEAVLISPARVRILLGLPPLVPTTRVEPKQATVAKARPVDVRAATLSCVEKVKAGAIPTQALREVGLPLCHVPAVRECAAGGGPITEAARTGDMTKLSPKISRGNVSFVRWYHDWPKILNQDDPGNESLRSALVASGLSNNKLGRVLGIHPTFVGDFISRRHPRMKRTTRLRVEAALRDHIKTPR